MAATTGVLHAQKSKVIAAYQLIETGKYEEAKTFIEEASSDDKTLGWPKTWHARGLLCQTAYQKGLEEKDMKKCQLYDDQLYVAYDSYENARKLDRTGRMDDQLAPLYVLLANKLLKEGEKKYAVEQYKDALKAYEHVILINNNPIVQAETDTSLVYNTALAAYMSRDWDKATGYLEQLNGYGYSSNIPHLLYATHLAKQDTLAAEEALIDGIHRYDDNEDMVLLLVDLLLRTDDADRAVTVLDTAAKTQPENYIFPFATGLVYENTKQYDTAITSYKDAIVLAPDEPILYVNIGTCYYNTGVKIQAEARQITNNREFLKEKARSEAAFESAREWLKKAEEKDPDNEKVIRLLTLLKV
ncbi:MAG: tetratricopeptide repeat protein [Bacteroidales bacterium]|nr:tetratricopeptide repeat protein [Bacteroidales bacterium]MDT8430415.1 tetratricopeptide repeat protein [Bacteroidales bacterium]